MTGGGCEGTYEITMRLSRFTGGNLEKRSAVARPRISPTRPGGSDEAHPHRRRSHRQGCRRRAFDTNLALGSGGSVVRPGCNRHTVDPSEHHRDGLRRDQFHPARGDHASHFDAAPGRRAARIDRHLPAVPAEFCRRCLPPLAGDLGPLGRYAPRTSTTATTTSSPCRVASSPTATTEPDSRDLGAVPGSSSPSASSPPPRPDEPFSAICVNLLESRNDSRL